MLRALSVAALLLASAALTLSVSVQAGQADLPIDKEFLVKAASAGHREVQLSRLADSNSKNQQVKQFAQMIVKDHTAANEKISTLLKPYKTAVVVGFDKEMREESTRLSKLENQDFDRAFAKVMVDDHNKAVKLFEHQAKSGKDQDAVSFAKETLPTLRKHLQRAQELATSAGSK